MKANRHVLFALAVLAALSLTACTLPTDPTFAGRATDMPSTHLDAAPQATNRAQS